jgi:hypothetical protein
VLTHFFPVSCSIVNVHQYYKYTDFWKGVDSCSIESEESDTPLASEDIFYEKVIIIHKPFAPTYDELRLGVLFLLLLLLIYPTLRYFRTQYCLVCGKKLVFFIDRCPMCRFVGAHPVDPAILAALESKGRHLQGEFPESFPGIRRLDAFLRIVSARVRVVVEAAYSRLRGQPQVQAPEEIQEQPVQKDEKEAWMDEIYNFQDDPLGSQVELNRKLKPVDPALVLVPDYLVKDVSSVDDRAQIIQNNIHPYIIYKAIEHPVLPQQPLGIGRQKEKLGSIFSGGEEKKAER